MRNRKASKPKEMTRDEKQLEAEWEGVDLDNLEPETLELDPVLRERIRSQDRLVQLTLRLGQDQIDEAKRVAAVTDEKYQRVLRRWVAEGASRARSKHPRRTA